MIVSFFVPVKPINLKNLRLCWQAQHRYKETLRGLTALIGGQAMLAHGGEAWVPERPKRIRLVAHLPRRFDAHDGLPMSLAPAVDGLQPPGLVHITKGRWAGRVTRKAGCALIHHDGPDSGHQITYDQDCVRPYGVTITVSSLEI